MHPVSFAFKRGHIRAVVAHKEMLRNFEITPARFDALYVIRWRGGSCYQSEIWQDLDLHPSTISRMLKSMEQRGLVARERFFGKFDDARQVIVTLTRKGFDTIVKTIKAFLRDDELRAFYNRMHDEGVAHIKKAIGVVRNIAGWLYDYATHPYSADRPDVAAGERYDAIVKREVEKQEFRRNAQADGLRGLAAIPPENNPMNLDYFWGPLNAAIRENDPAAWNAKVIRDFEHHSRMYELAYLTGDPDYD